MDRVRLTGTGFTPGELPVFEFETTLEDGRDLDGRFSVRFVVGQLPDGQVRFGLTSDGQTVLGYVPDRDTRRVIRSLFDHEAWLACVNYTNTLWEVPEQAIEVPLLGRLTGDEYDWAENYELGPRDLDALRRMRVQLVACDIL